MEQGKPGEQWGLRVERLGWGGAAAQSHRKGMDLILSDSEEFKWGRNVTGFPFGKRSF